MAKTCLLRALPVGPQAVPGQGDQHRVRKRSLLTNAPGHFVPVQARQFNVQQHHIRLSSRGLGQRAQAVMHRTYLMA